MPGGEQADQEVMDAVETLAADVMSRRERQDMSPRMDRLDALMMHSMSWRYCWGRPFK